MNIKKYLINKEAVGKLASDYDSLFIETNQVLKRMTQALCSNIQQVSPFIVCKTFFGQLVLRLLKRFLYFVK